MHSFDFLPSPFFFLYQHLETVIKQKLPSIVALINKSIDEINAELDRIGRPIAVDSGVRFLPICNRYYELHQDRTDSHSLDI